MRKFFYAIIITLLHSALLFGQNYESYKHLLDTTFASKSLGFDKNITITVPFEWQKDNNREFPLIVIFDRQNPRSHNFIINAIDYLTSNDQMPSSIIVSIESVQEYRYIETQYNISNEQGKAAQNEKFIFEELIPLLESDFNASSYRLFIGHSRYGYFTTSLLFTRLQEVNAIISLSPFFSQTNIELTDSIPELNRAEFTSKKYYRFGIGSDYPDDFYKMDSSLQNLTNPSIDASGVLFKEATHNVTPGLTITAALYEVFEYWAKQQNVYFSDQQKELGIIKDLNNEISKHFGSDLPFSLGVLNGKGWFLYNIEEYNKAIEAWEILLTYYPSFSETYLYIIDAQLQMNQDVSSSVRAFRDSMMHSDFYSESERQELEAYLEELLQ